MAITIPPELREKINQTQADQAEADKVGIVAAGTVLPGPMRDVWCAVPDIKEGPYTIRRFKDGDFIRLAQMGHPLDSMDAIGKWLAKPTPSGPDAWLMNWLMTRPVDEYKTALKDGGPESVKQKAEQEFSELDGFQLAHIMGVIVKQLSIYMGAKVDYEPVPSGEASASPPPSSQPS